MKDMKSRESMERIQTTNTKRLSRIVPITLCSKTTPKASNTDYCYLRDCLLKEIFINTNLDYFVKLFYKKLIFKFITVLNSEILFISLG
jgi:hypothetical protein